MPFLRHQNLSIRANVSHNSLPQPITPPNTPAQFQHELPSYAQALQMTTEQHVNLLNTHELGSLAPFLGAREEANDQLFYDPTEPHPLFSFVRNRTHQVPLKYSSRFADQLPLGFTNEEWIQVWKADEFKLDTYLKHVPTNHGDVLVPWTNEYEYHGVYHRLTIDHESPFHWCSKISHGTTIQFRNCNGPNFRYVVDHCVHQDDLNAYLKVICYSSSQRWYNICSYRPPLILVIPKSHCKVRFHPHLSPTRQQFSRRSYTKIEQEIIDKVLRGYHGKRSQSFWNRLFCR